MRVTAQPIDVAAEDIATAGATPTDLVVELSHVSRRFGDNVALSDLSLTVPRQRITVLLGPNGAGKTTAIRMITGALNADGGSVSVFGMDPNTEGEQIRRRCGVVSAKPALYDRLSGYDNLAYSAELYGLGRGDGVRPRIRAAAARFGIDQALSDQVGGYSTGMKTRLALARSVLHEPDLLLFDEPTSGLDPESSHAVLEMIREMTGDGCTVVMCTHLLLEAEGLAEKVVVLEDGADVLSGTPVDLIRRFWPTAVVQLDAEDRAGLDRCTDIPGVRSYQAAHGATPAVVQVDDLRRVPDLVVALSAAGVRLTRVEPHLPTLEDLYFAVRGRREVADDGGRQLTPVVAIGKAPEVAPDPDPDPEPVAEPVPLHAVPAINTIRRPM
jgi:ABC-2 type transport system ATP-binding protein